MVSKFFISSLREHPPPHILHETDMTRNNPSWTYISLEDVAVSDEWWDRHKVDMPIQYIYIYIFVIFVFYLHIQLIKRETKETLLKCPCFVCFFEFFVGFPSQSFWVDRCWDFRCFTKDYLFKLLLIGDSGREFLSRKSLPPTKMCFFVDVCLMYVFYFYMISIFIYIYISWAFFRFYFETSHKEWERHFKNIFGNKHAHIQTRQPSRCIGLWYLRVFSRGAKSKSNQAVSF